MIREESGDLLTCGRRSARQFVTIVGVIGKEIVLQFKQT